MYKAKLWDEDKWNIHSSSYTSSKYSGGASDKKEDKKYNEQKYGSDEKSPSSDYMRNKETKEKDDKKKDDLFEEPEEKSEKKEIKDEEIPFRAANQVFAEHQNELKKPDKKKDINTIEDAIKKAIEEEKKVIIMDS